MTTLILPSRHTPDTQALWRAAINRGWDVDRLQSLDVDPSWRERDPVLYVDGLTAEAVQEPLGVSLVEPPLDFLTTLPGEYVARPVAFTTAGEARKLTERTFIKPAGDKAFPAKVYESGEDLPNYIEDDLPVLTASPVIWHTEYRFFVCDRQTVAGSLYLYEGQLMEPGQPSPFRWGDSDSFEFITKLCKDERVTLPEACVIDVGLIRYTGWAVVEANPAWGAGILDSSPDKVLDVLRRATVPVTSLNPA